MSKAQRFAVIGLGRFGTGLARALASANAEVIAIDRQTKLVDHVRDDVTVAVRLDGADEEALKAQGVHEVDVAVVSIGEAFEASAMTVANLKALGVPRIVARAESDVQAQILTRIGAHEIASPEHESALRWAHRLSLPTLTQYIELGDEHSIVYVPAPTSFHHKTPLDLGLRRNFGVNLIAIERPPQPTKDGDSGEKKPGVVIVPVPDTVIRPGDILVLIGSNEDLSQFPRD
jgi:trk system potassium uptake protein TrkA